MLRWWDSVWKLTPGRVALAYMVFGGFWILVAHLIISPRLGDSITHISFEVFVGLTFVVLTGSVLYALLRRGVVVLGESERVLATLMRNLPGIAYRRRNEPQWTMIFLSDGCRVLTGYLPGRMPVIMNEPSGFNFVIQDWPGVSSITIALPLGPRPKLSRSTFPLTWT